MVGHLDGVDLLGFPFSLGTFVAFAGAKRVRRVRVYEVHSVSPHRGAEDPLRPIPTPLSTPPNRA